MKNDYAMHLFVFSNSRISSKFLSQYTKIGTSNVANFTTAASNNVAGLTTISQDLEANTMLLFINFKGLCRKLNVQT